MSLPISGPNDQMAEKFWFLKECKLFQKLGAEQIRLLESKSQMRTFDRKSLVYLPEDNSDSVLLLISGRIRIYHLTADGKEAVLGFVDPREIFGELAVFESGQREEFAQTMEKSSIVKIPGHVLQEMMETQADLAIGITKLMGMRRQRIERRLKSLLFRSNRERLVHLLLELAERYGKPQPNGLLLGLKLSHQELANIIGSTRETVTVLLGELQDEGHVEIKRRQLILKKPNRLAESIDMTSFKIPSLEDQTGSPQVASKPKYGH